MTRAEELAALVYRPATNQAEFDAAVAGGNRALVEDGEYESWWPAKVWVRGAARVKAHGGTIRVSGGAMVAAYGDAKIIAQDDATVIIREVGVSVTSTDRVRVLRHGDPGWSASAWPSLAVPPSAL